jgi:arylsulfatase
VAAGGDFLKRSVEAGKPFFLYFDHSMMHLPTVPRRTFKSKTRHGDWADCLIELDGDFSELLDYLQELGVVNETMVVFSGDNGPEEAAPWRGTAGYFEGSYFAMHGRLAANSSDDSFSRPRPRGSKKHRSGAHHRHVYDAASLVWLKGTGRSCHRRCRPVPDPHLINLDTDPREREPFDYPYLHSWVDSHIGKLLQDLEESVKREPLIPAGAPLDFVPDKLV